MAKGNSRKRTLPERLKLWTTLLCRPEGVTYDELNTRLSEGRGEDYQESLRQDIRHIKGLLEGREEKLLEGNKKEKTFRLTSHVDLVALHKRQKNELIYLLAHTRGFLPEDFIETLSEEYREALDSQDRAIVSFETDYGFMEGMDSYPIIYKAITNRQTLMVHYHRMHRPEKELKAYFCPDFLKQYHSAWYAFGMVKDATDSQSDFTPGRIALAAVDEIEIAGNAVCPYQSSHCDYESYFSEIIGIERDENCEQESIRLRVSNCIYDRIMTTPLHATQERCRELDDSKHKGIELYVRRNKELIRMLLSYGSDVEVVSPAILRRQMMRELRRMQSLYAK